MPKKRRRLKRDPSTRSSVPRKARLKERQRAEATLKERIARARKLEALDARKAAFKFPRTKALASQPQTLTAHALRNVDFPQTYIQKISVSVDDPDHWLTLTWTGPKSDSQETGPFRCRASNKGLIAILALHSLRGSCRAEASRCIISRLSRPMPLLTVVCGSSQ